MVTLYANGTAHTQTNAIGAGFVGLSGSLDVVLPAQGVYDADFAGVEAPILGVTFTSNAGDTVVQVPGFVSPWKSTQGYVAAQIENWPFGWFADQGLMPVAFNVAFGLAVLLAQTDSQAQRVRLAMRGPTCIGPDLDSWQRDFLGDTLPRYPVDQTDASYWQDILAALSSHRLTLAALQYVCDKWALARSAQLRIPLTTVRVMDLQSDNATCLAYGAIAGDVVIEVTYHDSAADGFFLTYSAYLDVNTHFADPGDYVTSFGPPDPRLDYLLRLKLAAGKRLLYAVATTYN